MKKEQIKLPESVENLQQETIKHPQFDKENDAIIDLLKLIEFHLKAIEKNTFKGY